MNYILKLLWQLNFKSSNKQYYLIKVVCLILVIKLPNWFWYCRVRNFIIHLTYSIFKIIFSNLKSSGNYTYLDFVHSVIQNFCFIKNTFQPGFDNVQFLNILIENFIRWFEVHIFVSIHFFNCLAHTRTFVSKSQHFCQL